jgi:hypothetical protein
MDAEQLDDIPLGTRSGQAEARLWAAVLVELVKDGQHYWKGKQTDTRTEQAFDDLVRCGPMTNHVCRWLEVMPEAVTRWFIRWCESDL